MASLLHELDNDAVLLMYAAGELAAEDRAEVEQMLARDAGLRAALAAVERDELAVTDALAVLDRSDPVTPSAQAVSLRRFGRAARQWQVDRLVRGRPLPTAERQPRFPAWAIPVGAAAAVLLGTVAWWGWQADANPPRTGGSADSSSVATGGDADPAADPATADETGSSAQLLADAFGGGGPVGQASELPEAERQANLLARVSDPAGVGVMDAAE